MPRGRWAQPDNSPPLADVPSQTFLCEKPLGSSDTGILNLVGERTKAWAISLGAQGLAGFPIQIVTPAITTNGSYQYEPNRSKKNLVSGGWEEACAANNWGIDKWLSFWASVDGNGNYSLHVLEKHVADEGEE
ncbi:hypothetical protein GIB67_002795 [Kingdonia uniflora]|uniref:Uncharacterized protein n=1 Tax=Kingdonia uniflora TaxID=39325 RepID=A0A7J7NZH7_9MAGN|nr:hypothetical protein GIB67_042823 [Kingdonia uniflora]KAF6172587.1 hypothetical protein GIB67_002360 [Kingdonia uniflora]KAF6174554.1 hypothetical protein GIB67_002795 [Kingdonia uniflora]